MKRANTYFVLLSLLFLAIGVAKAQNHVTYGFVQDPVDQLKLTAVAYPNYTSNNVTISTALFTFYLPAGTTTLPDVPVLPASGSFTNITGVWKIEKITPALYGSFGFNANDLQGNDIYQCILQNSPTPNASNGVPIQLFSLRLPGDCIGGVVRVHINDNSIHNALLNNVGININNQMSMSVNDQPSVDIYFGNNPLTDDYPCPLDDVPVAVDDVASTNEDVAANINVTLNDNFGTDGPSTGAITILSQPTHGTAVVDNNGTPNNPTDDRIIYTPAANYNGPDAFTYQICDSDNDCDPATVNVTVNAVNDPPIANGDVRTTPEDTPITFNATTNDTDIDGAINPATLDLDPIAPGQQTSFTVAGGVFTSVGGDVTFTPTLNFFGSASVVYQVCDNGTPLPALCDTAIITINVTPVNDAPVANGDVRTTPEDTPITLNATANDTDIDGTVNPATLDLDPIAPGQQTSFTVAGGTFTSVGGQVTFTPVLNFVGAANVVYQVCDNGTPVLCDTAIITVNVTPVNDAPLANGDNRTTTEDTPITLIATANDTDVDGNINPATLDLDPNTGGIQSSFTVAGGTFTHTGGGSVTFVPTLNFVGIASAIYQVCDDGTPLPALCDTAIIRITVTPVNDPPTVPNTTVSTPEDTPTNVCVPITDVDNTTFTVSIICGANHGTVSGLTNPATTQYCLTYTPAANFNGTDSLCVLVCDAAGGCDTSYVYITVTPVNDPPVANDDAVTTPEDAPLTFTVTTNDTDIDGLIDPTTLDLDPNTAGIQTTFSTLGGVFTYNGGGSVTFTPTPNFNGTATAVYNVCDTGTPLPAQCDLATITVTVTPVNDAPVANGDVRTTPEDTPITLNATANDTDIDGTVNPATLDLDPIAPGQQTSFTVAGGTFTSVGGQVTFTPALNFVGVANVVYQVCDNGTPVLCDTAIITVNVTPVNDAPLANGDNRTTTEDTPITLIATANDTDVDGNINPATLDLDPNTGGIQSSFTVAGGTFTHTGGGSVTFVPTLNFVGIASAIYQVCDDGTPLPALCDTAIIRITVTPVNDPPTVPNTTVSTPEDTPTNVCVPITDTDNTTFTVSIICGANHGTVSALTNPATTQYCLTYTPASNFNGTDSLCVLICDGAGACDTSYVYITVTPVNDPPVANDDAITTPEDASITLVVTANDTDIDGAINPATLDLDPNTPGIQSTFTVPGGTFTHGGGGSVTFTPTPNFNGTATAVYNVCDTGTPLPAQCDLATITITVTPVNDVPTVPNVTVPTPEETPVNVCVPITDVDNTTFVVSIICGANHGTVTGLTNPATTQYCLTYTPASNFTGTDSLCVLVCDGAGGCDTSYVYIPVTPVNDPPVANDDVATTPEDAAVTLNVLTNDTDIDGAINPATVDLDPNTAGIQTTFTVPGGVFTYLGAGDVSFTPNLNFNGTATATYNVCDTGTPLPAQCDQATITITVTPVNDPPVANDDAVATPEDNAVTFNVTANDTDVDGTINPATLDLDPNTAGIQTTFTVPGGVFTYNGGGSVTFTPNPNFNGPATAVYNVCDTGTPLPAQCDLATITVTVNAVNDAPVANDDVVTTPEDAPSTFSVTANDTDVDGNIDPTTLDLDPNIAGIQTTYTVPGGVFTYNGGGSVTFTPTPNFNGTATAVYNVCDTGTPLPAQCDLATITVTVTPVNDAPIANNDSATTTEDVAVPITVLNNDTDIDGTLTPGSVAVITMPTNGTTLVNPTTGVITYTPNLNFVGNDSFTYAVCDSGTPVLCDTATVSIAVEAISVRLLGVVRLQGALLNMPDTLTLMRDNLRSLNRLPKKEPYTALPAFQHVGGGGNETVTDSATVFSNRGANSIVDWVFVELRNPSQPTQVVATRSALLQRDGDIVDMDGLAALTFENVVPASYYVSVRHRNHLGVMTAAAITLTNAGTIVDFSNLATPLWDDGTNLDGLEQKTINGKFAMWAGNVNTNTSVVFAGQSNDKDPIFNQIDQAPGNFLHSQSYIYNGYHLGDVNLDGKAVFAGQTNDVDFIFNNVDGHPRNITHSQSFVIRQQLPQ